MKLPNFDNERNREACEIHMRNNPLSHFHDIFQAGMMWHFFEKHNLALNSAEMARDPSKKKVILDNVEKRDDGLHRIPEPTDEEFAKLPIELQQILKTIEGEVKAGKRPGIKSEKVIKKSTKTAAEPRKKQHLTLVQSDTYKDKK